MSESGQPRSNYVHSKQFSEVLRSKMGGLDGKILFHHKLQYAEIIIDILETVEEGFKQGLMVTGMFHNKHKITTEFDIEVLNEIKKLWYYGWYNIVQHDPKNPENILSEEISVYYPSPSKLNDYTELLERPALKNMIPREDISGNWGVTIQTIVPVSDALRYTRYTDAVMKGKFFTMYDDRTVPDFDSQQAIKSSIDYVFIVPQEWYNRVIDMIFPYFKKLAIVIYITVHKMIEEMEAFSEGDDYDDKESGDITKLV